MKLNGLKKLGRGLRGGVQIYIWGFNFVIKLKGH